MTITLLVDVYTLYTNDFYITTSISHTIMRGLLINYQLNKLMYRRKMFNNNNIRDQNTSNFDYLITPWTLHGNHQELVYIESSPQISTVPGMVILTFILRKQSMDQFPIASRPGYVIGPKVRTEPSERRHLSVFLCGHHCFRASTYTYLGDKYIH